MTFKEKDVCGRINAILLEEGLSDHQAAKRISEVTGADISLQNVSSMRMRPGFGADKLVLFVAAFPQYSPEWIISGKGDKYRKEEAESLKELRKENEDLKNEVERQQKLIGDKDVPALKAEIISLKERLADCRLELADCKVELSERTADRRIIQALEEQIEGLKKQLELSRKS
jgi:hypothetical protein